ncbi:hypothetical protein Z043_117809, partial [Scleropages formosus]
MSRQGGDLLESAPASQSTWGLEEAGVKPTALDKSSNGKDGSNDGDTVRPQDTVFSVVSRLSPAPIHLPRASDPSPHSLVPERHLRVPDAEEAPSSASSPSLDPTPEPVTPGSLASPSPDAEYDKLLVRRPTDKVTWPRFLDCPSLFGTKGALSLTAIGPLQRGRRECLKPTRAPPFAKRNEEQRNK